MVADDLIACAELLERAAAAARSTADKVRAAEKDMQRERDDIREQRRELDVRSGDLKRREEEAGKRDARTPPARSRRSPQRSAPAGGGGRRRSRSRSPRPGPSASDKIREFCRERRVSAELERKLLALPHDPAAALCVVLEDEMKREKRSEIPPRILGDAIDRLDYLDRQKDAIGEAQRALRLSSRTTDTVRRKPFTLAIAILAKVDPIDTRNGDREVEELCRMYGK
eukprot:TRINITY_DN1039_c0_g3_i1.p2 TRINITY_DN1039_c0_g3~~TRINITY_DN1039_c0_g3_i1.p2  ORF type:complete len:262 (+),score=104.31 TRINITY_DN1039_c0_g3_i1:108-788(+)